MAMVREFFTKETSHRSSEEMNEALLDIALTFEDMAIWKSREQDLSLKSCSKYRKDSDDMFLTKAST
jgi:hypothetical protein